MPEVSKRLVCFLAIVLFVGLRTYIVRGSIPLSTSSSLTQNFDGMGTAATASLPTDFRVDKPATVRTVGTFAAALTATSFSGGANLSSSASNGIYNFGAGTTTTGPDRAVGFLSSGTATFSGNLYAQFVNNTGGDLSGLGISYNVEKYRHGSNPAGFRIQLFYSTDGTAWTDAGSDFTTTFGPDSDNTGFATAPGATVFVSSPLIVTIPNGSNFYLAWNYSVASGTTTTNAQALAIDDISILGVSTGPTATGSANPGTVLAGGTTLLTATVTPGFAPASTGLAVTANLTTIGGAASQQFRDDGLNGDAVAGDNVFSYMATVAGGTLAGAKSLPVTVTDAQMRSGATTIALTTTVSATSPTGVGSAAPASMSNPGDQVTFTVSVTPGANPDSTGLAVTADLTPIGGLAAQPLTPNGNVFSVTTTVPGSVMNGTKTIVATVSDAQNRSTTTNISLSVAFPTSPTATTSASPNTVAPGDAATLTVSVTPGTNPASSGIAVRADLSSIGGSAAQAFSGSGNTFTFAATVGPLTTNGAKSLPVTITDAQGRSTTASIALTVTAHVQTGALVISQVYGGGGNSGSTYTNDFIEIFNPGPIPVSLDGWSVQETTAGTGTNWAANGAPTPLSGTINPGQYYLVKESQGAGGTTPLPTPDASGVLTMGAGSGKVALVAGTATLSGSCPTGGTVIDLVGYGGAAGVCAETSPTAAASNTTAAVRKHNGCVDTDNNANDFIVGGPIPRNSASPLNSCGGDPSQPSGFGVGTPSALEPASNTLLTVQVIPAAAPPSTGVTVVANLSSIAGSATQALYDDGTHGDAAAGDNVFSFLVTTGAFTTTGPKSILATIADAEGRSATAPITLTISSPSCGVERWSVKTGTDADAGQVDLLNSPTRRSIFELGSIPVPAGGDAGIPLNNRIAPTETTTYVLNATMTLFKKETDVDYHIVLFDDSGHSLIAEIPSPGCVAPSSPFGAAVSAARVAFDQRFTAAPSFTSVAVPVQVTGVGFFDFLHGQTGVAPNGIELHPVLNITFTANTMTTLMSNANPSQYGQGVTIVATVTNTQTGPAPTGSVTLFDNGSPSTPVALDANGQATFSGLLPTVGTHGYIASYEGDNAAAPSTSLALVQVVNKADQTITFTPIAGKTYGAADFTLDATASSGFPVTFSIASGPATVFGNLVHITGVGTVAVHAAQDGDANHNAAPGVDRSFDVAKATPLFSDLRSATVDDNPPVSTVLSGRIGLLAVAPTGSVSITVNGETQSAPITADGTFAATFGPMPAAAQPYPIVYAYAGDGNFNAAANGSGTLTVRDRTAPTIAAHPDVIAEATSAGGAAVWYAAPATSDNVDPAGIAICVPVPNSQFSLGTTIVSCNATDTNHNAAAATSFTVTVVDSTPPARPALAVDHGILWPPDNKLVPVTITAQTSDAVTASPACTITGITKNDDDGAFTITGPLTADLLAIKIQDADELVYRLTVSCTDGAGNTSQPAAINVIVPHDQGKGEQD